MTTKYYDEKELHFWIFVITLVMLFLYSNFSFYFFGHNNGMVEVCSNMGLVASTDSINDEYRCFTEQELEKARNETNISLQIQKHNEVKYNGGI